MQFSNLQMERNFVSSKFVISFDQLGLLQDKTFSFKNTHLLIRLILSDIFVGEKKLFSVHYMVAVFLQIQASI